MVFRCYDAAKIEKEKERVFTFDILKNKAVRIVALTAFFIYFIAAMADTSGTIKENKHLLAEYKKAISRQEEISRSIKKEESEQGSDEQIERIARERLGLCKSNEKIFTDGE